MTDEARRGVSSVESVQREGSNLVALTPTLPSLRCPLPWNLIPCTAAMLHVPLELFLQVVLHRSKRLPFPQLDPRPHPAHCGHDHVALRGHHQRRRARVGQLPALMPAVRSGQRSDEHELHGYLRLL